MNVRRATPDDIPFIEHLLADLYAKHANCFPGIAYDAVSTQATILATMERGIVIVSECACAGALIQPFPWNDKALIGWVHFWAFSEPRGVKILGTLARVLKRAGATHFMLYSHWPKFRSAKLYRRLGLKPCELSCIAPL